MIYFLQHDSDGEIRLSACSPLATIVPLIDMVSIKNEDGSVMELAEPVGIDADTYNRIYGKLEQFRYDATSGQVVAKDATNG